MRRAREGGAHAHVPLTVILAVLFLSVEASNVFSRMYPLGDKSVHGGYGPNGRVGHTAVSNGERVFVWGGRSMFQNGDYLNDMWMYDWNTGNWTAYSPNELVCEECSVCGSVLANQVEDHGFVKTSSGVYVKCDPEDPSSYEEHLQKIQEGGYEPPGAKCEYHMTCFDWTGLRPYSEALSIRGSNVKTREAPSGRYYHGSALVEGVDGRRNLMIMFGGYGVDCTDYCADTWHYDVEHNVWQKIREEELMSGWPARRWKMGMTNYKDTVIMFGGHGMRLPYSQNCETENPNEICDGPGAYNGQDPLFFDDLWMYNATQKLWQPLTDAACPKCDEDGVESDGSREIDINGPRGRHSPSMVTYKDSVIMFGGYAFGGLSTFQTRYPTLDILGGYPSLTGKYYLDDLWQYNVTENSWEQIHPLSKDVYDDDKYRRKPQPRYGHTASLSEKDGHSVMLVYGGVTWDDEVGDLWQFNISSKAWLKVEGEGEFPSRRGGGQMVAVGQFSPGSEGRSLIVGGLGCLAGESYYIASHDPEVQVLRNPYFNDLPVNRPNRRGEKYCVEYLDDLWQYYPTSCPRDCSRHGICSYNVCICDNGYSGIDCSFQSCGAKCEFDYIAREQDCAFCSSPVRALPNETRGTCNGLDGSCECNYPASGKECELTECIDDCNDNGLCDKKKTNSQGFGVCVCDVKLVDLVGGGQQTEAAYSGQACEVPLCPKQASSQGTCNLRGTCEAGNCVCYPGYGDSIYFVEEELTSAGLERVPTNQAGKTFVELGLYDEDEFALTGTYTWTQDPIPIADCGDLLFYFAGVRGAGPGLAGLALAAAAAALALLG